MEENSELLNPNEEKADPLEPIEVETSEKSSRSWWPILQLLGAYLVGAWTLLQFLDWVSTRYQISPYWVDLFMWIFVGLLPGFLFYLLYKERIDRFGTNRKDKFVLSSNLVILVLVLFFSFRNTDLGATTKEISYTDADGVTQQKTIVKQEFREKIRVFNFEPLEVDSAYLWLDSAIPALLTIDAQQDKAFTFARHFSETSMAEKLKLSEGFDLFVDGQFRFDGELYEVTPRIYATKNGRLQSQQTFFGKNLYVLIDSLSVYIREHTEVAKPVLETAIDLPIESFTSSSLEAIKYYSMGGYANLERAIALDSTFALASWQLGRLLSTSDRSELDTRFYFNQAFRHREKLPFDWQQSILSQRYLAYDNFEAAEKVLQLQLEIDPENNVLNQSMINVYTNSQQFDKLRTFTDAWSKRDLFASAEYYAMALQLNLESRTLLNTVRPFATLYPNNEMLNFLIFKAHLLDKNWEAASRTLEEIKLTYPRYERQIQFIEQSIEYQRTHSIPKDQFQAFFGTNQFYGSERTGRLFPHPERADLIIAQVANALPMLFPYSDTQLIEIHYWNLGSSIVLHEMKRDSNDRVYAMESTSHRQDREKPRVIFSWRIDSLVLKAEALLHQQDYEQAEIAYQEAIAAHPKLYFLKDALQHIQYVQSKTAAEIEEQLLSVAGQYADRSFWVNDGRLYYKRTAIDQVYFPRMVLLPISEDRFVNLSRPNVQYGFEYDNGQAIASYSYLYNRDSSIWLRNGVKNDYLLKKDFTSKL